MKMRKILLYIGCLLSAFSLNMEYEFSYINLSHLFVFLIYFISLTYFTQSWFYLISGLGLGISIIISLIWGIISHPEIVPIVFDAILALGMIAFYSLSIYQKLSHQQQHQTVFDSEINQAALSGSGTMNDPYLLDFHQAPAMKAYVTERHEKIIYALHGGSKEYGTSRYGFFDGILVGKKHTSQIQGGFWINEESQKKTKNEEPIWVNGVVYLPFKDVQNIGALLQDQRYAQRLKSMQKQLAYATYDESYRMLMDLHIDEVQIQSLLRALGKKQRLFSKTIQEELLNKIFMEETYYEVMNNKDGMIYGSYQLFIDHYWIQYAGMDAWVLFPTLYEPSFYYGKGTYQSYS